MKSNILAVLILSFFFCTLSYAQKAVNQIEGGTMLKGRDKVLYLKQKGDSLFDAGDYVYAARFYENSAIEELSLPNPDSDYVCQGFTEAGFCYESINQYQTAISYYKRSLEYAIKANNHKELAAIYNNLGTSYLQLGLYADAIKNFEMALEIDKKLGSEEMVCVDLNNLGKVYESWKKYGQALSFYKQSLDIALKRNDNPRIAIRMSSIGMTYKRLQQLDSAEWYLKQALAIDTEIGNPQKIAIRLSNLGAVYTAMKKYKMAEDNLKEALAIFYEYKVDYSLAITYHDLGECYLDQNFLGKAKACFEKSLEKSLAANIRIVSMNNYKALSVICEKEQNIYQAFQYYKKYSELKDSIFSEENLKMINDLQVRYETDLKEQEIFSLKQQEELNLLKIKKNQVQIVLLVGFSIIGLALLITLYSRFLLKKKHNTQLSGMNNELKKTNATKDRFFAIIAHDIKNPLSAFKNITGSLTENFGNLESSTQRYYLEELHESSKKLFNLMSNLLNWAKTQTGTMHLNPEKVNLKHMVDEIVASQKKYFTNENIFADNLIAAQTIVIADKNVMQVVLGNIIGNAFKFSYEGGKITLSVKLQGKFLKILIEDQGISMTAEDTLKLFNHQIDAKDIGNHDKKGSGLGLILCKELIGLIGGDILVSSEKNKGSLFTVVIPYLQ
jgi:signal transduction histidine kinase